jgi:hypothetical protein
MKPDRARQLLALEAARILSEEGRRDHLAAKRKAAARLRLPARYLPTNREVEEALVEHQQLFEAPAQAPRLERLRRAALQAMDVLTNFEPRAAGAATSDVATAHAPVQLHVFTDTPETVAFRLADLNLDWSEGARRIRWRNGRQRDVPLFSFKLEGDEVEALVFTLTELREAPADPVDGRPMKRLNRRAIEALL